MKKIPILILFILMVNSNLIAQNDGVSAFLLKWENSKNYLLEIAEAMPEANYNFKPTERQMSFKEQLLHIRQNMLWLSETYFMENDENQKISQKKRKYKKNHRLFFFAGIFGKMGSCSNNVMSKPYTIGKRFYGANHFF